MHSLSDIYKNNFLEYASYVIKDRAIPDLNDGLKPVQRRILHSLHELDDGKYNKVANTVGNTMKYHPHGDASIYEALVGLANKEYFFEKQGNFGNILTGDEASAARYIECRLSALAKETLFNRDITEYMDSYDGRNKEPLILPAKLPVLLLLGAEGIAVGMSTKILPHNFNELLEAQIAFLEGREFRVYPDFLQGGMADVTDYDDGRGKVRVRARIELNNDKTVTIREIPFGTTTQSLISSIENAARRNYIKISSINDYTTENVEIEIKAARGESPEDLLSGLYAFTDCEITLNLSLIAIVNGKPAELSVTEILKQNTLHLRNLLKRELEIDEKRLLDRLHDMTLEQLFIENRIYKEIEELEDYKSILLTVRKCLERYKEKFVRALTDDDIEKLLEIKIKRISRYDINKNRKGIDDIVKEIKKTRSNLLNLKDYTIKYLKSLIEKYGKNYPRKTKIKKLESISVKEVKQPDVKMVLNEQSGFIGTDVKGEKVFTIKPSDKIIAFNKKGVYKVIAPDSKVFVDTDIIYIDVYNPDTVFTVVYTDGATSYSYIKKFSVSKFINAKEYSFIKDESSVLEYFSAGGNENILVKFVKKPKLKVLELEIKTESILVKNYNALGYKISEKEIESVEAASKGGRKPKKN